MWADGVTSSRRAILARRLLGGNEISHARGLAIARLDQAGERPGLCLVIEHEHRSIGEAVARAKPPANLVGASRDPHGVEEVVIWGLTYRMLGSFTALLAC